LAGNFWSGKPAARKKNILSMLGYQLGAEKFKYCTTIKKHWLQSKVYIETKFELLLNNFPSEHTESPLGP
jgi:hypothetical protein